MDEKDFQSRVEDGVESLAFLQQNFEKLPFDIQLSFLAMVERFTAESRQLRIAALQRMGGE